MLGTGMHDHVDRAIDLAQVINAFID